MGLFRKINSSGIDQVNANQLILAGNFLRPNVFFNGFADVSSPFHSGIVGNNQALTPLDKANSGNNSGGRKSIFVLIVCGKR